VDRALLGFEREAAHRGAQAVGPDDEIEPFDGRGLGVLVADLDVDPVGVLVHRDRDRRVPDFDLVGQGGEGGVLDVSPHHQSVRAGEIGVAQAGPAPAGAVDVVGHAVRVGAIRHRIRDAQAFGGGDPGAEQGDEVAAAAAFGGLLQYDHVPACAVQPQRGGGPTDSEPDDQGSLSRCRVLVHAPETRQTDQIAQLVSAWRWTH
jgi:hypothetical protein